MAVVVREVSREVWGTGFGIFARLSDCFGIILIAIIL